MDEARYQITAKIEYVILRQERKLIHIDVLFIISLPRMQRDPSVEGDASAKKVYTINETKFREKSMTYMR